VAAGNPSAAFDNLLCRPRGGRMGRHMHVDNLPAGVMDHEEHVQRSKRDGFADRLYDMWKGATKAKREFSPWTRRLRRKILGSVSV
jgi:hypothetical protein